jgi:hypothetical protein
MAVIAGDALKNPFRRYRVPGCEGINPAEAAKPRPKTYTARR